MAVRLRLMVHITKSWKHTNIWINTDQLIGLADELGATGCFYNDGAKFGPDD